MSHNKGVKNLIPFSERSPEERRRISSMGGKKAAEKREQNKTFEAAAKWALNLPADMGTNTVINQMKEKYPGLNNYEALAVSVMARGIIEGDVKVLTALRDTVGEVPSQRINLNNSQPMVKIEIETVD